MIHVLVLAAFALTAPAPTSSPVVAISAPVSASTCTEEVVRATRVFEVAAQLAATLIATNAVRHGARGGIFASASLLGNGVQYAALDVASDQLDRRASCKTRAALNALFGVGSLLRGATMTFPTRTGTLGLPTTNIINVNSTGRTP